jgi:hypothetical protein
MISGKSTTQGRSNDNPSEMLNRAVAKPIKKGPKRLLWASREKALDDIRTSDRSKEHDATLSARHSKSAFHVLKENASCQQDMALNAQELQLRGVLGQLSRNDMEVLSCPVPPSVHLEQASELASISRLDCVLAVGEPEPIGEERRLLLAVLEALQKTRVLFAQVELEDVRRVYEVPLGEAINVLGPNGPLITGGDIVCKLTVEKSEIRNIKLLQKNCTLLDICLPSATEVDEAMMQCLGFDGERAKRTVENYKKVVGLYCRWAQAQRDAGVFRPLLKDMLLRQGNVKDDPDLQEFSRFYSETSNMARKERPAIETYATFAVLRDNPSNRQRSIHSEDQLLLNSYRNLVVQNDFRNQSYVYNNLRIVARWLHEYEFNVTLVELCSDEHVSENYAALLNRIKRKQGLCSCEPILGWLSKLRIFKESFDSENQTE